MYHTVNQESTNTALLLNKLTAFGKTYVSHLKKGSPFPATFILKGQEEKENPQIT